eukprot:564387-Rhodomonas_salina.1
MRVPLLNHCPVSAVVLPPPIDAVTAIALLFSVIVPSRPVSVRVGATTSSGTLVAKVKVRVFERHGKWMIDQARAPAVGHIQLVSESSHWDGIWDVGDIESSARAHRCQVSAIGAVRVDADCLSRSVAHATELNVQTLAGLRDRGVHNSELEAIFHPSNSVGCHGNREHPAADIPPSVSEVVRYRVRDRHGATCRARVFVCSPQPSDRDVHS